MGGAKRARNPSEMGEKVRRRGGRQIASPFLSARYCASARKDRSAPRSTRVRDGVEQWRDAGIITPVLVPLSPDGNQMNGLKAVFAAFER